MQNIKSKLFWIGSICAVVILLIIFATLVFSLLNQKSKYDSDIKNEYNSLKAIELSDVWSQKDIENLKKYKGDLLSQYNDIKKYYKDYDDRLEQWFEGLPPSPLPGDFKSKYKDKCSEVENELKNKGIICKLDWENLDVASSDMKKAQKRYWIIARTVDAVINSNANITKLDEIAFLDDKTGAKEYKLPESLGTTIPFKIRLKIRYESIPQFLIKLLNPDSVNPKLSKKLLIMLRSYEIKITKSLELEVEDNDPEKVAKTTPGPMDLELICDVLDFEFDKAPKFE